MKQRPLFLLPELWLVKVPANKSLFTGTGPVNKELLTGMIEVNNLNLNVMIMTL